MQRILDLANRVKIKKAVAPVAGEHERRVWELIARYDGTPERRAISAKLQAELERLKRPGDMSYMRRQARQSKLSFDEYLHREALPMLREYIREIGAKTADEETSIDKAAQWIDDNPGDTFRDIAKGIARTYEHVKRFSKALKGRGYKNGGRGRGGWYPPKAEKR